MKKQGPPYSHRFFENLQCEYHPSNNKENPCHRMEHINCLACFCSLFWVDCPNPQKTCATCTFPHDPDNYDRMMEYLARAYEKEGIYYDKEGRLQKKATHAPKQHDMAADGKRHGRKGKTHEKAS